MGPTKGEQRCKPEFIIIHTIQTELKRKDLTFQRGGRNEPATIRRPGAETKVGGFPQTTIGFKPALNGVNEEEESASLRGCDGG